MQTSHSINVTLSLLAVASFATLGVPAALLAVEGESQIAGTISKIEGDRYTVHGDSGKDVTLRVTKDTNVVCAGGKGNQTSTGRETGKEHQEIPPIPHMEQQAKQGKSRGVVMPEETQAQSGALSKDPSKLKDVVGSTDPKANEDVAKGSGFTIGSKEGCAFKVGDQVKIEASDTDTATTIQQMSQGQSGSKTGSH
ncbi:MAG: hypothetical protein H0X01_05510 [Nitrospira sp.]|nr:hypothetical protein [Nitrospira sp.]